MKQSEVKELIQLAIEKTQNTILEFESFKNQDTQTIVTHRSLIARKNALEDVLAALNNNPVYLRMLAGK